MGGHDEMRFQVMLKVRPSEITPESVYLSRRKFIGALGMAAATPLLASSAVGEANGNEDLRKELTPLKAIANYNNFYEFSTNKEQVAPLSQELPLSPWKVKVAGHVSKPTTFDIDDLRKMFPQEERIYRLRCVEAWSMVIPWTGFPLASLLKVVEPTAKAKFVRF